MHLSRGLLAASLACIASAAQAADPGFYFGIFGGQAEYEFDTPDFIPIVATPGPVPIIRPDPLPFISPPTAFVAATSVRTLLGWPQDADDQSTAYGLTVGYRIMRYAAVELSYLDLGSLERSETFAGGIIPPVVQLTFDHELETSGPAVSGLGVLPLTDFFEVYGRVGVFFADMEHTTRLTSSTVPIVAGGDSSVTFGSESLLWGVGAQFNWGEHWTVRLDFQRFDAVGEDSGAGEADIDLLTLGVLFRL